MASLYGRYVNGWRPLADGCAGFEAGRLGAEACVSVVLEVVVAIPAGDSAKLYWPVRTSSCFPSAEVVNGPRGS